MAAAADDAVDAVVVDAVDVWSNERRNDAVMWSDEIDAVDNKLDFTLFVFSRNFVENSTLTTLVSDLFS